MATPKKMTPARAFKLRMVCVANIRASGRPDAFLYDHVERPPRTFLDWDLQKAKVTQWNEDLEEQSFLQEQS
jgi:hypothetical protein